MLAICSGRFVSLAYEQRENSARRKRENYVPCSTNSQIFTRSRQLPLATHRPFVENAATATLLSDDSPKTLPVCVSSTAIWCKDMFSMNLPSGEYWIDLVLLGVSIIGNSWMGLNVFASQMMIFPSTEAVVNISLVRWHRSGTQTLMFDWW